MAKRRAPPDPWKPKQVRLEPRAPRGDLYSFPPGPDADLPLPAGALRRLGPARFACADVREPLLTAQEVLVHEWRELRIFHRATGRLSRLLRLPGTIQDVAWDSRGREVLAIHDPEGTEGHLLRWDRDRDQVSRLAPEIVDAQCLAVSPDGTRLVVGRKRGLLSVLALPDGALIADHTVLARRHYTSVHAVAVSPDGALAAGWTAASWDQFTEIEHAAATLLILELPGGRRRVRRAPGYRDMDPRCGVSMHSVGRELEFSRDGARLRSKTGERTCWTFSARTGRLVKDNDELFPRPPAAITEALHCPPGGKHRAEISPDGRQLMAQGRIIDTETGASRDIPGDPWRGACFRDRGRELVVLDRTGEYTALRSDSLAVTRKGRMAGRNPKIHAPRAAPQHLIVMERTPEDPSLTRYARATMKAVPPIVRLDAKAKWILPTWGSERCITYGDDRLFLHDFRDGSRQVIQKRGASFTDARAAPDDRSVAYFPDAHLAILDLASGEDLFTHAVRGTHPTAVAFSPSGRLLAAAFSDWIVRLFDLRTGVLLSELPGHTAEVTDLLFDPTEALLFSLGADGLGLAWDGERLW